MKRPATLCFLLVFVILEGFAWRANAIEAANGVASNAAQKIRAVSIPFIQNRGQIRHEVAFYARTFGGMCYITKFGELVYRFSVRGKSLQQVTIREILKNSLVPKAHGLEPCATQVRFFNGHTSLPGVGAVTYQKVSLGEVLPNIELELKAYGQNVEKIFRVRPKAKVSSIQMRLEGVDRHTITKQGRLLLHTEAGTVQFSKPVAYQKQHGVTKFIPVAYQLTEDGYTFKVGRYDPDRELIIDPLLQSTYLGSGEHEEDISMAIHPTSGDVYVTGATQSADFPQTANGAQSVYGGGAKDGYVARLSADLTTLLQVTFFGGSSGDNGNTIVGEAIAIHPDGQSIYIAGHTTSTDLPGTTGGYQTGNAGQADAFVARFSTDLKTLLQATYIGGERRELGYAIAINAKSDHANYTQVYVLGSSSMYGELPGTSGGAQPTEGGGTYGDAFVSRLNADLTSLLQTTYLGGNGEDTGYDLTIHPLTGDVCITGNTYSADFPATTGGAQEGFAGIRDAFVSCLNPDLTAFLQSTYLGGTGVEYGTSIEVDSTNGDIYISGQTYSTDLPNTQDGVQPTKNQVDTSYDAFVAHYNSSLTTLYHATYLGGSKDEYNQTLAIHPDMDQIYLSGETYEGDFPGTAGGADESFSWKPDVYVARLSKDLATLHQATYLGGSEADSNSDIAIHPTTGEIYVAGYTYTSSFPGVSAGAQTSYSGGQDAFVSRFDTSLAASAAVADISLSPSDHDFGDIELGTQSSSLTVTVSNNGEAQLLISGMALEDETHFLFDTAAGDTPCNSLTPSLAATTACTLGVTYQPQTSGTHSTVLNVTSNDPDQATASVTLAGTAIEPQTQPAILVTPNSFDFGEVSVLDTSGPQVFNLNNTGDADLQVSDITHSDPTNFDVDLTIGTNPCLNTTPTVAPASGCTFGLTYQPQSAGTHSETLTITSNDPDQGTLSVSLSGSARPIPESDSGCGCTQGRSGGVLGVFWLLMWGCFWYRRYRID